MTEGPPAGDGPAEGRVDGSVDAQTVVRARPRLLGRETVPLLIPLLAVLAGLLCCWLVGWRAGLLVVSAGVALAGVERLVLPRRLVGLLAVRGRVFDVVVLIGLAVGLVAMTFARG